MPVCAVSNRSLDAIGPRAQLARGKSGAIGAIDARATLGAPGAPLKQGLSDPQEPSGRR